MDQDGEVGGGQRGRGVAAWRVDGFARGGGGERTPAVLTCNRHRPPLPVLNNHTLDAPKAPVPPVSGWVPAMPLVAAPPLKGAVADAKPGPLPSMAGYA
jgi:hypothetical protein